MGGQRAACVSYGMTGVRCILPNIPKDVIGGLQNDKEPMLTTEEIKKKSLSRASHQDAAFRINKAGIR